MKNIPKSTLVLSLLVFIGAIQYVISQDSVLPGGVTNPYIWIKAETSDKTTYLNHVLKDSAVLYRQEVKNLFNYNPSVVFDASKDSLIFPLNIEATKTQTLFVVYKVQDSLTEQFLWHLTNSKKTLSVATNKRLADLKSYSYQTYKEKIKIKKANIHVYQHNKSDKIDHGFQLKVGTIPKAEKLPPQAFKGAIAEIIIYDRVLNTIEKQKISSYLAVKYGISLSQLDTKNYLSGNGTVIWETSKHEGFEHNITAIGRDSISNLLQSKSSNMYNEGLLTIGFNVEPKTIPNNTFVFWSDNDKNLTLRKVEEGEPIGVDRHWQINFNSTKTLPLLWKLNPSFIEGPKEKDTYYWLMVDSSGKGTYKEADTEFINIGTTQTTEPLKLENFNWNKSYSGSAVFTLKVAPEMFSKVWITEPICGQNKFGKVHFNIEGGQAPFTIIISTSGNNVIEKWSQNARALNEDIQLTSGTYTYNVSDALGHLYADTFFITDKEATASNLDTQYTLEPDTPLILDAGKNLEPANYKYQWLYESIEISTSQKIVITKAGNYELRLTNSQDCKTSKKFTVEALYKNQEDMVYIMAYPNPVTSGRLNMSLSFPEATNATISIHTVTGTLIKQTHLSQQQIYNYQDNLTVSGMYLVTVSSSFGTKAFKIIVK